MATKYAAHTRALVSHPSTWSTVTVQVCLKDLQGIVLAGAGGDVLFIIEALDAQVAVIAGAVLRGGFDTYIAVVRRAYPCGDDEDLNVRVPRDGPGG